MRRLALYLAVMPLAAAGLPSAPKTAQAVAERCQKAGEYSFEGEFVLGGQQGSAPGRELSRAKVKVASAPGGKYYLRLEPADKDAYVLVSNGEKSWAWVPRLKQYSEEEAAPLEEREAPEEGESDTERDLAEAFVRMVMPVLGRVYSTAQSADFNGEVAVKVDGKKGKWPLLRVLSRPAADGSQTLTQLAVDPETLNVGRMVYSTLAEQAGRRTVIQMTLNFSSFRLGPVPESTFTLTPPGNHKLVDVVPIPGQTGSLLVNQPAPDFELSTLEGNRVRLSSFRGRPVLLTFWASWCGPCRRELPEVSGIYREYNDKGLVVMGVNDEGKAIARRFAAQEGLPFPTLDDGGLKAHRLYRVRAIPSTFLISADGKVVRFFRGARSGAALRAALAAVGL